MEVSESELSIYVDSKADLAASESELSEPPSDEEQVTLPTRTPEWQGTEKAVDNRRRSQAAGLDFERWADAIRLFFKPLAVKVVFFMEHFYTGLNIFRRRNPGHAKRLSMASFKCVRCQNRCIPLSTI